MYRIQRVSGARNNSRRIISIFAWYQDVSFQGISFNLSLQNSCLWPVTARRISNGRALRSTFARQPVYGQALHTEREDVTDDLLPHGAENDAARELKRSEHLIHTYGEHFFASATRLPPDFFHDVHLIRNLASQYHRSKLRIKDEEQQPTFKSNMQDANGHNSEDGKRDLSSHKLISDNADTIVMDNEFVKHFWPEDWVNSGFNEAAGKAVDTEKFASNREGQGLMDQYSYKVKSVAKPTPESEAQSLFRLHWTGPHWQRRKKIDLSWQDAMSLETERQSSHNGEALSSRSSHGYRVTKGLRGTLNKFINNVQECVIFPANDQDKDLESRLLQTLRDDDWEHLKSTGYDIRDVQAWSWILLATPAKAVRRWVIYSQWLEQQNLQHVPHFIVLQLLRSKQIDAFSLSILIEQLEKSISGEEWESSAKPILIVRLLRYARLVAPELFGRIIDLNFQLFPARSDWSSSPKQMPRITHWFNRLLSLLALPTPIQPFRSMRFQQDAQLEVVRHMHNFEPPIQITREGYRALLGIQLMHNKTDVEKDWARVKAPSWPPWQLRDQMGYDTDKEYSGKHSRVMKVLQRMQETGYQLGDPDIAAQILAGWDTDRSPTIQTRRLSNTNSTGRSWLLGQPFNASELPAHVWAARVDATRSVREAWMCFCSYTEKVPSEHQSTRVYQSMFSKMLAKTIEDRSANSPLPGDGLEAHLDPILPRDRVYIPEPVPTVAELYIRMKKSGLKPGTRMLGLLLDHADTIENGFKHIEDSVLRPETKEALLNPNRLSREAIRNEFAGLPSYLLGSYIYLLSRQGKNINQDWRTFPVPHSDHSTNVLSRRGLLPLNFALEMLFIASIPSSYAWNQYFRGLSTYIVNRRKQAPTSIGLAGVWAFVRKALKYMHGAGATYDLETFRMVSYIALQLQTWDASRATQFEDEAFATVQELFMQGTCGKRIPASEWIPTGSSGDTHVIRNRLRPSDLYLMLWHVGVAQSNKTIEQMLEMLRWMSEHQALLKDGSVPKVPKHTLATIRVILEGHWADDQCWKHCNVHVAAKEQLEEARRLCLPFGWALDEDVEEYLERHQSKVHRLRRVMLSRRRFETGMSERMTDSE